MTHTYIVSNAHLKDSVKLVEIKIIFLIEEEAK